MMVEIVTSPCPIGVIQQWQNKLKLCMTFILVGLDMLQCQLQSSNP